MTDRLDDLEVSGILTARAGKSTFKPLALGERGSTRLAKSLKAYDRLLASNLLEAELRSALHRARSRHRESSTFLRSTFGRDVPMRGADLWHLAVALFIDPEREIDFLTLDERQRTVSRKLGFGP
jgi:hypothetical protein